MTGAEKMVAGLGIGMLGGEVGSKRNYKYNKKLMAIQLENQQALNQQGHDLQMDMWNKTNYGAQIGHMRNAGLNPGMMYGMSGGGGTTTGSQGGGSAASGSAQQWKAMDLQNALVGAQVENIKQDTENKKADTENKSADTILKGYTTEKVITEIDNIAANTKNTKAVEELNKVKTSLEQKNVAVAGETLRQLRLANDITEDSYVDIVGQIAAERNKTENDAILSAELSETERKKREKLNNDIEVDMMNAISNSKNANSNEVANYLENFRINITKKINDENIGFATQKMWVDNTTKFLGDLLGLAGGLAGKFSKNAAAPKSNAPKNLDKYKHFKYKTGD
jgi:hypothetical protein